MPGRDGRGRAAIARSLLAALVVGGCAGGPDQRQPRAGDGPVAAPEAAIPARDGLSGGVLDHLRAGVEAMEFGAFEAAAASFDVATAGIETGGNTGERVIDVVSAPIGAAAVGGDVFRGEPYERAMAYYYRGLLHLMAGDYRGAGAAFRDGVRQDAFGDVLGHDFALLAFLEGWAAHCDGDRPRALRAFRQVQSLRPALGEPDADHNVLLVAETGRAPSKYAGSDGEPRFRRGDGFAERRASFIVDGARIAATPAEDLYHRASGRRGREVEEVLPGTTPFGYHILARTDAGAPRGGRGGADAFASVSATIPSGPGSLLPPVEPAAGPAPAAAAPGVDLRYWDNLPDRVHLATLAHPATPRTVVARFEDENGRTVAERPATIVHRGRCSIAWARSRPAASAAGGAGAT